MERVRPQEAPTYDRSVSFGDDEEIQRAFREDGVVVVRDVINDAEVRSALDELFESPRLVGRASNVQRDDPKTWGGDWPQSGGGLNFLESLDGFQDTACWQLHTHHNVVHLNKLLYGQPVYISRDARWGVMRPTAVNSDWKTKENWLHWDQNPWTQPDFWSVQSFICLTDQTPTSGGFLCSPGFHKGFQKWGEDHPKGTLWTEAGTLIDDGFGRGNPFPVPENDEIQANIRRVLAPCGSMVLWDGRTPHQNYPNTGDDFRVVMYTSMYNLNGNPCDFRMSAHKLRKKLVVMGVLGHDQTGPFPNQLTPLARELLGLPNAVEEKFELTEALQPGADAKAGARLQDGQAAQASGYKDSEPPVLSHPGDCFCHCLPCMMEWWAPGPDKGQCPQCEEQVSAGRLPLQDPSWQDPKLHQAIQLAHEAGMEERNGNDAACMKKFEKSMKMWGTIERQWYPVIF